MISDYISQFCAPLNTPRCRLNGLGDGLGENRGGPIDGGRSGRPHGILAAEHLHLTGRQGNTSAAEREIVSG